MGQDLHPLILVFFNNKTFWKCYYSTSFSNFVCSIWKIWDRRFQSHNHHLCSLVHTYMWSRHTPRHIPVSVLFKKGVACQWKKAEKVVQYTPYCTSGYGPVSASYISYPCSLHKLTNSYSCLSNSHVIEPILTTLPAFCGHITKST